MNARIALAAFLACAVAQPARGDVVTIELKLGDTLSGWSASYDDGVAGVVVDSIKVTNLAPEYVDIEIAKQFTAFVDIPIEFLQTSSPTAPLIRIADETIVNFTGQVWTDFHWELAGSATFSDPDEFYVGPFTRKVITATTLDADLGVVGTAPPDNVFRPGNHPGQPGGPLYIHPVVGDLVPTRFTLIQRPTPEPGTMWLLAVGGAALLRRSRRG